MTTIAERMAQFSCSLTYDEIPADVVHLAKRMMIDTIGCAIGGYTSEPSKIARDLASTVISLNPCTVIGSGQESSPDLATYANGVMIRYLDYNDGYTAKQSGHPSDSIAAVLSATELAGQGGKRAIVSTIVAYEIFCRLGDAANLDYLGFDHVTNGCVASVLGAARGMGLSVEHTTQAINLAIAPNIALHQTRVEVLSHWKGCAYANASRNAVFAALLAERGLTGPAPIFEGVNGFFKVVTRDSYELDQFGGNGEPFKISECTIKRFPLGLYSQTVVQAALEARDKVPNFDVDEVAEVNIRTLTRAINIMADDEEKWDPKTRETADHSMPYTTAVARTYGFVNQNHFDDEYIRNEKLLSLTSKVKIEESEEANLRVPEAMLCYMDVVMKSGEKYSSEVPYHKGHYKNPMTDEEVEFKFRSLVKDLLSPAQTDELLTRLWDLENIDDIGEVMRLTKI